VLIWKGGQTAEGARAAASHTGVLAKSGIVWETLIRQSGAIKVDGLDEMVDVTKTLLYAKPTNKGKLALIATTGGPSVTITDTFVKAGFEVPPLSKNSYQKLASFFNTIGGSYQNPLDILSTFHLSAKTLLRILDILDDDANVDSVILDLSIGLLHRRIQQNPQFANPLLDTLSNFKNKSTKPLLVILNAVHQETLAIELRNGLVWRGVPSFPSYERAANALKKAVEYYRFRKEVEKGNW